MKLKEINNIEQYKLCYVEGRIACFTNIPLSEQWGDDWDDAPYEHNAGWPYEDSPGQIVKVMFDSRLSTPCEYCLNSPYSVESINNGATSWLWDRWGDSGVAISAGCSIQEFVEKVKKAEGAVFFEIE